MAKCGATVTRRAMVNRVKRFHKRDAALAREAALVANPSRATANAVAELSVCSDVSLLSPPTHDTRAVAEPGTGNLLSKIAPDEKLKDFNGMAVCVKWLGSIKGGTTWDNEMEHAEIEVTGRARLF